jgi:hypothetical protein
VRAHFWLRDLGTQAEADGQDECHCAGNFHEVPFKPFVWFFQHTS